MPSDFRPRNALRWRWLQRCWALFGLLLMISTWRLWVPQAVYPQVPLVAIAGSMPVAAGWSALAVALACLVIVVGLPGRFEGSWQRYVFIGFGLAMVVLILIDQHRLQPWAYQLVIYAAVFASLPATACRRREGAGLLRLLMLSIYCYSALGKFDYQFLHTVGQQFVDVLAGLIGLNPAGWPGIWRLLLAASFPAIELLLVALLAVPRWRRAGVGVACLLHGSLLVILGPWGLQHEPGVLIWNLFFVTQAVLLFGDWGRRADMEGPAESDGRRPRCWIPTGLILLVVCLPALEPFGWFDHWPAWALYSPRNRRAVVEVHRAGLARLPEELKPFLAAAPAEAGWVRLDIDRWSLAALSVPIYPQDRFQLGVAEWVADRYDLDRAIRVRLQGMSHRVTGARTEEVLTGRQQIVAAGNRYFFNAHSRR